MIYTVHKMDPDNRLVNVPWKAGDLRNPAGEGRWHITTWPDEWYKTAAGAWAKTGEVHDGQQWRPLTEWMPVWNNRTGSLVAVARREDVRVVWK